MADLTKIGLHDKDIRLAINEYVCAGTVNRNIRLLLENDVECNKLFEAIFGKVKISAYSDSQLDVGYSYGSVIWYNDYDYKKQNHFSNRRLWLLKCIENDNKQSPAKAFDLLNMYGQPDFEKYGWTDLNYYIDPFDPKFGLKELISRNIQQELKTHSNDISNHKYGKLSIDSHSQDFIDDKLVLRDISNVSPQRTSGFFPYQTGHFTTNSILNGTYRVWDCGLLEFDIVFRFGFITQDADMYDVLSCNNVRFNQSPTPIQTGNGYQENSKYFYAPASDMSMFQNADTDESYESVIGNLKQGNRNNFVNTYFAKLDLFGDDAHTNINFKGKPITEFSDLNYMVFSSSSLSQDKLSSRRMLSQSDNCLSWCDKTRRSIIAMLITYPEDGQEEHFGDSAGLAANSFSCHIIGHWKSE